MKRSTSSVAGVLGWAVMAAGLAPACADEGIAERRPESVAGGAASGAGGGGSDGAAASAPSGTGPGGAPPIECPYEGPPLVDPAIFPPCPPEVCAAGGHCVDAALVPADQASLLAACDDSSKCVPDAFIATLGNTIAPSCSSVLGYEGRCVSTCIPQVAAQAADLPQDVCASSERCVPCYDPFQVKPTGACTMTCDPGPAEPPPAPLPSCCDGKGTCVPPSLIPAAQQAALAAAGCGTSTAPALCVPNELLDPSWKPLPCQLEGLFTGGQPGACYPECLGAVQSPFVKQGSCKPGFRCAPCENPLTGEKTGACPWD
jgi:hypothetical protein